MGSNPPVPPIELLPPEAGSAPPPQTVRRPRSTWAIAPATHVLVAINCLVFLAMILRGVSPMNPTTDQLLYQIPYFGADHAGLVLMYGQWWRIVTAMFMHVGIIHLATNMWCLWNLGLLAEPLMGSVGVLSVYLLTGAAGNLLSTFENWREASPDLTQLIRQFHAHIPFDQFLRLFPAGAGASGAVFGIAGALIVLLKSHRLPVPPRELHKLRRSVIYFAAINLAIGFSISFGSRYTGVSIDNMAHLGGFSCGLLFAAPMVPRIGSARQQFTDRRNLAVVMVTAILVLFGVFLARFAG